MKSFALDNRINASPARKVPVFRAAGNTALLFRKFYEKKAARGQPNGGENAIERRGRKRIRNDSVICYDSFSSLMRVSTRKAVIPSVRIALSFEYSPCMCDDRHTYLIRISAFITSPSSTVFCTLLKSFACGHLSLLNSLSHLRSAPGAKSGLALSF